mmetsp:Transcript_8156/g.15035  ORF Transcript_8156/g.15035 Transcript_8156/m.15035 type:complete len:138 (-) Transcript_8156:75-488(-)
MYGFTVGPIIALISVILSELFGTKVLPLYHGCSRLAVGFGAFAGPPFIAYLAESHGYHLACAVAGSCVLAGGFFLLLLAWLQPCTIQFASKQEHRQSSQDQHQTKIAAVDIAKAGTAGETGSKEQVHCKHSETVQAI